MSVKSASWDYNFLLDIAQRGVVVPSFTNLMSLFVVVFAADLAITYPLAKRVFKDSSMKEDKKKMHGWVIRFFLF